MCSAELAGRFLLSPQLLVARLSCSGCIHCSRRSSDRTGATARRGRDGLARTCDSTARSPFQTDRLDKRRPLVVRCTCAQAPLYHRSCEARKRGAGRAGCRVHGPRGPSTQHSDRHSARPSVRSWALRAASTIALSPLRGQFAGADRSELSTTGDVALRPLALSYSPACPSRSPIAHRPRR